MRIPGRTTPIELLERLDHPETVIGRKLIPLEETHWNYFRRREPSYLDQFWTGEHDERLRRLVHACGKHTSNYLFDSFRDDFEGYAEEFVANLTKPRRRRRLPPSQDEQQPGWAFFHRFSEFLNRKVAEALGAGQAEMFDRTRRCALGGDSFQDQEGGASISYHRRRVPRLEVLAFHMDIRPLRLDAFLSYGEPEHVVATLEDYGRLIDALGFFPAEASTALVLLENVERARFYEVLPLMGRCYSPWRYANAMGGHIAALFATGRLGPVPVVRGTLGYRAVAEDGHLCSSLAEKTIDDWMHRNGIPHEKEPPYPTAVREICGGRVRADWRVGDLYVEYFGLQADAAYARKTEAKLDACRRAGVRLLALYPGDETRLARAFSGWLDTAIGSAW